MALVGKYPRARVFAIFIDNKQIYPGVKRANWVVGQKFTLNIIIENVGEAEGKLWCRIVDARTGREIGERRVSVPSIPVGATWGTLYTFTMTEEGYDMLIEVGHVEYIGGRI